MIFSAKDVESTHTIRLLSTITEYQQDKIHSYWSNKSTCPFTFPIGRDAFKLINAHIDGSSTSGDTNPFSIDQVESNILNLIMANARSVVAPNNVWNFDELMFPHATLRDPLVAFLPRKPHPIGIVAYLGGVLLSRSKLPFILFINPATSSGGISGPHAFQSFLLALKGKD